MSASTMRKRRMTERAAIIRDRALALWRAEMSQQSKPEEQAVKDPKINEVESRALDFINNQDPENQRALTHADIIKISDGLDCSLSHEQRSGMLRRIKALLIFMPAVKEVCREDNLLNHMKIDDIRPFITDDGWPVILPPKWLEDEKRSHQLVEALKLNGWDEKISRQTWQRRAEYLRGKGESNGPLAED